MVQNDPNGYIDIWAREHYKSTIITFGKTIQDILSSHGDDPLPEWNGQELTVGIFSFNRPAAKKFLRQIKLEFESNEELKLLFPDVLYKDPKKESPKWSEDDGIIVKRKGNPREGTVEASGLVDGQPTGMHYGLRLYDDVVTLESARSIEMIKKTSQAWGLSLSLGKEGGIERYVGTFYADGDSYHDIIEQEGAIERLVPATKNGKSDGQPVLFSQGYLDSKKKAGIYDFSCQYLCDPVPDTDAYFRRDDFQLYDTPPANLHRIGAGDYAVTEDGGDFTEIAVAGVDEQDNLYVLDWWSGQETADVWIDAQIKMHNNNKPQEWFGESGVIRRSIEPFLKKRMRETSTYFLVTWLPTTADKPAMCRPFQARARQGKVYLPRNAPWTMALIEQAVRFPKSKFDDKVDVLGLLGRALENIYAPNPVPVTDMPAANDGYGWEEDDQDSEWKTV